MLRETIDIGFDFRKDSKCGDPDTDSQKLYDAHRLLLTNNLCMNLSSDRMCPHFDKKYSSKFNGWLQDNEIEELKHKVRTIGGHLIFPAHKKNGFTINQARGINRIICDRFDLTLECIRRLYLNENSPLLKTLENYKDFFDLFIDFNGYIEFFLLQDFINDKKQIKFSLPFDNFNRLPLPQSIDEYRQYKNHVINLIDKRNSRIQKSIIAY